MHSGFCGKNDQHFEAELLPLTRWKVRNSFASLPLLAFQMHNAGVTGTREPFPANPVHILASKSHLCYSPWSERNVPPIFLLEEGEFSQVVSVAQPMVTGIPHICFPPIVDGSPVKIGQHADAVGGLRVQNYLFNWKSPAMGGQLGACHALETCCVFVTYDRSSLQVGPEAEEAFTDPASCPDGLCPNR
jgi:hypothetical protein